MSHLHGQSEKLLIHILRRPLRMVILRILRKIKNKHISLSHALWGYQNYQHPLYIILFFNVLSLTCRTKLWT